MKRIYGLVGLLLVFGLSMPAYGARSATPASPDNAEWWGMVVRDPAYEWNTNPAFPGGVNQPFIDAMFANLQAAGVQWVRFEFHGTNDGSEYGTIELAQADYFVQAADAHGIKVLALLGTDLLRGSKAGVVHFDGGTVSSTIPITSPDRELSCLPTLGCGVNPYQKAWLERALLIADYYKGRVDAFELFNEQNFYFALINETNAQQDEMNPRYVAQTITKFFRILHEAPRLNQTPIIIGGLHPKRSLESGRTDREYLAALYNSSAFTGYNQANGRWPVDGVGYHPYPTEMQKNDNAFLYLVGPRLDGLITTLRAKDSSAKLWLSEVGTRGDPNNPTDLTRQAEFMRLIVAIFQQRRADIATWFWFKYEDFPPASEAWGVVSIPFDANGNYDVNGTVQLYKPAYSQYRRLALNLTPRVWIPLVTQ